MEVSQTITVVDSSIVYSYQMNEMVIGKNGVVFESEMTKLKRLENRIMRVYPYAKACADNLTMLQNNLDKLESKKDKKRYQKMVEKYLTDEFEPRLKNLSRKEGQILIKLINRQTGKTTFSLVKDLKSGWSAFWSNNAAKIFDLNLKAEYMPMDDLEDFYIESILTQKFRERRLQYQEAASPIDLKSLAETWKERAKVQKPQ